MSRKIEDPNIKDGGVLHLTYREVLTYSEIAETTGINKKFLRNIMYHYDTEEEKDDRENSSEEYLSYVQRCGKGYYWRTMVEIRLDPSELLLPVGYYLEVLNKIAGRGPELLYSKWEENE